MICEQIIRAKKVMSKVAVLTVAGSAIGIVDLPIKKQSDHCNLNLLLIGYLFAVWGSFALGLSLLLFSLILPRVPNLVLVVKILVWVDLILLYIALSLMLMLGIHGIS
ncbi:hypothetical protein MRB53_011235 [Persea americana]|uniref:Uncharacterized protein n=1 Tax=Persea americana TaxID=3435 RepID=A0ACC2LUD6_PERAE|nr:hypothetical protein MRB53_011235 [Persea americana]